MKQNDVVSNLDYLVQKGWVKKEEKTSKFTTKGGTERESTTVSYKISDIGLDKLQGASSYNTQDSFKGINVTNIGGISVVGSNNVVNATFASASQELARLEDEIKRSDKVSELNKLNLAAEIATIQSQLSKPEPSPTIVQTSWKAIEKIVTAGGLVDLLVKVSTALGPLLGA